MSLQKLRESAKKKGAYSKLSKDEWETFFGDSRNSIDTICAHLGIEDDSGTKSGGVAEYHDKYRPKLTEAK